MYWFSRNLSFNLVIDLDRPEGIFMTSTSNPCRGDKAAFDEFIRTGENRRPLGSPTKARKQRFRSSGAIDQGAKASDLFVQSLSYVPLHKKLRDALVNNSGGRFVHSGARRDVLIEQIGDILHITIDISGSKKLKIDTEPFWDSYLKQWAAAGWKIHFGDAPEIFKSENAIVALKLWKAISANARRQKWNISMNEINYDRKGKKLIILFAADQIIKKPATAR